MAPRRSILVDRTWDLPGVGAVRVQIPTTEELAAIDESWPLMRTDGDRHHAWRWTNICEGKREKFVLLADSSPIGIWCTSRSAPVKLAEGSFYRLDFVEARPDLRGGAVGVFTLAMVATRAIELGAQAVVLSAFPIPGLVAAYLRAGATQRLPKGWNCPPQLVPLVFEQAGLVRLKDLAHGLLKEAQAR